MNASRQGGFLGGSFRGQIRLEERRKREPEAARFKAVETQAAQWRRSQELTGYLRAVGERKATSAPDPDLENALEIWLSWAEAKAKAWTR